MGDYDDPFRLMVSVLRKPSATKALEDLTNEEFGKKVVSFRAGKKITALSLGLVKSMAFSAASGAAVSALSGGNLEAVKEGAYLGAALGTVAKVLEDVGGYMSYVLRTRRMTQEEKSASLKEWTESAIKRQLFTVEQPLISAWVGIGFTGFVAITYFALNLLAYGVTHIAGTVGTGERIFGLFSLNGSKAFLTGLGSGALYTINMFRTSAAMYQRFERKLTP